MDSQDWVPETVIHVIKSLVSKYTGIVDDYVYAAESVDCSLDHRISIFRRSLARNCFATVLLDLLCNIVWICKIVDNNRGSKLAEQ